VAKGGSRPPTQTHSKGAIETNCCSHYHVCGVCGSSDIDANPATGGVQREDGSGWLLSGLLFQFPQHWIGCWEDNVNAKKTLRQVGDFRRNIFQTPWTLSGLHKRIVPWLLMGAVAGIIDVFWPFFWNFFGWTFFGLVVMVAPLALVKRVRQCVALSFGLWSYAAEFCLWAYCLMLTAHLLGWVIGYGAIAILGVVLLVVGLSLGIEIAGFVVALAALAWSHQWPELFRLTISILVFLAVGFAGYILMDREVSANES